MDRNSCIVEANLTLQQGVSVDAVRELVDAFSDCVGGRRTNVVLEPSGEVSVYSAFFGYGGTKNEEVSNLATSLSRLVAKPCPIVLMDFDTDDPGSKVCEYLTGASETETLMAKLAFALNSLRQEVGALISDDDYVRVVQEPLRCLVDHAFSTRSTKDAATKGAAYD